MTLPLPDTSSLTLGPLLLLVATLASAQGDPTNPLEPLLGAIEELESEHDAKCYSSASRFEDFVSGTPLSPDARLTNVSLQKRLIARVWSRASQRAQQEGESKIGRDQIDPELAAVLQREDDERGVLHLSFPGGHSVSLKTIRASQYRSVAYSLRAILSVQQDAMFAKGEPPLELDSESLEVLRETLDSVTLAALRLADRDARLRNQRQLSSKSVEESWLRLLPELAQR